MGTPTPREMSVVGANMCNLFSGPALPLHLHATHKFFHH